MTENSTEHAPSRGVLDGVTVLDFSHVLSGPFATLILADLGATVIKVERPDGGDGFREGAPFVEDMSHQFAAVNRGKHGVTLDLKAPEGRAAAAALAQKADVVINNFRPGVMDKLGLGAQTLCDANPRLVYASVSGFGQAGSLSHKPAFDPVIQAMSGLMSLTGEPDGAPLRAGVSWGDLMAGTFAAMAIITALYDRERTGQGQVIDIAMFDSLFYMLTSFVPFYQATGILPERAGSFHQVLVPTGTYPTKDGYLALSPVTQQFWRSMCRALGKPEWIDDPRFSTLAARQTHRQTLIQEICAVTRQRETAEWAQIFDEHDVPSAPILDIADLVKLPIVQERGLLADLGYGDLSSPISPFHLSGSRHTVRKPAPRLGADTEAILRDVLAYTPEQVEAAQGKAKERDGARR